MVIVKKAVERVVKSGHVILCHDVEGLWIGDGGVWFFVPGAPRMTETEFRSLYDVPQTVKISEEPDALAAYSLNHTEQGDEYLEKVNTGISLGAEAYLNPARGLRFLSQKVIGCFSAPPTVCEREGPGGMRHLVFKDGLFVCGAMKPRQILTPETMEKLEEFLQLCRSTVSKAEDVRNSR